MLGASTPGIKLSCNRDPASRPKYSKARILFSSLTCQSTKAEKTSSEGTYEIALVFYNNERDMWHSYLQEMINAHKVPS